MIDTRSVPFVLLVAAALLFAGPAGPARAEEFSFYGVTFGMTTEEVAEKWQPLTEGKYAVPSPFIGPVQPRFDYENRLYELTFSVDLEMEDPTELVNRAYQDLVNAKWGNANPKIEIQLVVGRDSNSLTVIDGKRKADFILHIREKIEPLLQP